MIDVLHKPKNLSAALDLITREAPPTLPMGRGTVLKTVDAFSFEAVSLEHLSLDSIEVRGKILDAGAAGTLRRLAGVPGLPHALTRAIQIELQDNGLADRSLAGTLVASSGASALVSALLALDASLQVAGKTSAVELGNMLHQRDLMPGLPVWRGQLITRISFNREASLELDIGDNGPAKMPGIVIAAAYWPAGRLRIVLGGWGRLPRLAMDAPDPGGFEIAVKSVLEPVGPAGWVEQVVERSAGLVSKML